MNAAYLYVCLCAVLFVGPSCGAGDLAPTSHTRAQRLEAQRVALDAALARMSANDIDEPVRVALEALFASDGDWFALDGWGIGRVSVKAHLRWSARVAERDVPRALDFDDPTHPFHAIVANARQLEEHGIELLVVPAPTRMQVYPDRLDDVPAQGPDFLGHDPSTAAFLRALIDEGVEVLDLLPILAKVRDDPRHPDPVARDRLFFDNDSHWTPRAVALAAASITERLAQMPGFERGAARQGEEFVLRNEHADFVLRGFHDPPPEPVTWQRVLTPDGEPAHRKDRSSPLLLLGDSYAMHFIERGCDLASQLYAHTGHRVDTITLPAGSARSWKTLERREDGLAGKRWVVWVFTARALELARFQTVELFGD